MESTMRTISWGVVMMAVVLCVSCPANTLLPDVQEKVEQAKAARMQTVATPTSPDVDLWCIAY